MKTNLVAEWLLNAPHKIRKPFDLLPKPTLSTIQMPREYEILPHTVIFKLVRGRCATT